MIMWMNQQREVIYRQRREVLMSADIKNNIIEMITQVVERTLMLILVGYLSGRMGLGEFAEKASQLFLPLDCLSARKAKCMKPK